MTLVDSNGTALRIKDARKLHGVGLFWGYNVFLNQRIKVELEPNGEPFTMSVEEVRALILKSFESWHGWATRGDFDELKERVERAQGIPELIELLKG